MRKLNLIPFWVCRTVRMTLLDWHLQHGWPSGYTVRRVWEQELKFKARAVPDPGQGERTA